MNNKYHSREHYEIVLLELMKFAERPAIDTVELSNLELLMQINNLLSYYNIETYSLDEIEEIENALNENAGAHKMCSAAKDNAMKDKVVEPDVLFDDTTDPFFSTSGKIKLDKDGMYLTREKRQRKIFGL